MHCDFHGFENCGICYPTGDLRDLLPVRTVHPGTRTETDLVAVERDFPDALTVLDWLAPSWYREHPEARLIRYQAIGSSRWQLMAIAGTRSLRWSPDVQVWMSCTRSVSSRGKRKSRRHIGRVGRRQDDHGEVRLVVELDGPTQDGSRLFAVLVQPPCVQLAIDPTLPARLVSGDTLTTAYTITIS